MLSPSWLIFCISYFSLSLFLHFVFLAPCLEKFLHVFSVSSVQSLSHVQLFATPWTAVYQAFRSITISRSSFKLMSIELVMPSNHLILGCPLLLLPSIHSNIRVFLISQFFTSGGQSIGASASESVLSMNIQD